VAFSLADHLAKGPPTAEDIAGAEGTDPSATFRLLGACASLGMVAYEGKSRFAATSLLDTVGNTNRQKLTGLVGVHAFARALALRAPR
jgi:DNA-binding IclR family transcriptional regulator